MIYFYFVYNMHTRRQKTQQINHPQSVNWVDWQTTSILGHLLFLMDYLPFWSLPDLEFDV